MTQEYIPPFDLTDRIVNLISEISESVGRISIQHGIHSNPKLRRENRIKTIHASLAIENNSLTIEQITDLLNGKRILGPPKDIKEAKNAYEAYEQLLSLDPLSIDDLLSAHKILMEDLVSDAGCYRTEGVGVYDGEQVVHMAPPHEFVPEHMQNLIKWYKASDVHPLVKSAVFHYEFEFIHPFFDGNGRMGRMWHTLLLSQWKEVFAWLPVETLVKDRQQEYYDTLGQSDKLVNCTVFIEFMLQAIVDVLIDIGVSDQDNVQDNDQVKKLLKALSGQTLSAEELMKSLNLKHKANFRKNYLTPALELGVIERTIPEKPTSRNQKYRIKC